MIRRGLVACLADDSFLDAREADPDEVTAEEFDVAVVSAQAAAQYAFPCPIVIASDDSRGPNGLAPANQVAGLFHQGSMPVTQLHATVHAAAAGLSVNHPVDDEPGEALDSRSLQVLEMIAAGHSTREIADQLSYSERTIKKLVMQLEETLHARSRAQVVARAIRRGLI